MVKVNKLTAWVTQENLKKRPFIISLDLNSNQRSIANRMLMTILTEAKRTIYDTYADLGLSGNSTYKERWAGAQPEKIDDKVKAQRIDFIFRSNHWRTVNALPYPTMEALRNNTMPDHGPWLPNIKQGSDHFCAFATLRLYKKPPTDPLVHGRITDYNTIMTEISKQKPLKKVYEFCLESGKNSTGIERENWIVDTGIDTIMVTNRNGTYSRAWISKGSFNDITMKNDLVYVNFNRRGIMNNRFRSRYFSKTPTTKQFFNLIHKTLKENMIMSKSDMCKYPAKAQTAFEKLDEILNEDWNTEELVQRKPVFSDKPTLLGPPRETNNYGSAPAFVRRRMAQREFS